MKTAIRNRLNILLYILFLSSCIPPTQEAPSDPRSFDNSHTDLLEVGYALPIFEDFMYAMEKTRLTYIMEEEGPYTIFAPIQVSFAEFRTEKKIYHIDQFPEEKLSEILRYHILPGNWSLLNMPNGYYPTLLEEKTSGNPIDLFIDYNFIFKINGLNIIFQDDIVSANGLIHAIKKVLKIPSMQDQLYFNEEFSLIFELLQRSDLDPELKLLLSDEIPDTFFAPTNTAVLAFLNRNPDWETIDDIPAKSLNEMIKNHLVSSENIVLNKFKEDVSLKTLKGEMMTVKIDYPKWSIVYENKKIASINIRDIQGANGIIHQVDNILMPSIQNQ